MDNSPAGAASARTGSDVLPQHTPGPWDAMLEWRAYGHAGPPPENEDFGRWAIVEVMEDDPPIAVVDTEADARLIAAAPDMLEALKEMIEAAKALARVIVVAGLTESLALEFQRCSIKHGFGAKAAAVIAKATHPVEEPADRATTIDHN